MMQKMQELIITVGISGSGKSTWAREIVESSNGYTVEVNRDNIRVQFYCDGQETLLSTYKISKLKEKVVSEHQEFLVKDALYHGKSVIVSDTNLSQKSRDKFKLIAQEYGVKYSEEVFDVPLETCLRRNSKRIVKVPERVIETQYHRFREFIGAKHWVDQPNLPKAVIFDIDGTLAEKAPERDIYDISKVSLDKPRKHVVELLNMYWTKGYKIIICSGRDDSSYEDTYWWLQEHDINFNKLCMRVTGDKRIDAVVKEEIFWNDIFPYYNVQLVVDDRSQVVRQWRAMGLECFQVANGDF